MKSIHQEIIDELKDIVENGGIENLRRTYRTKKPAPPMREFSPAEIKVLQEQGRSPNGLEQHMQG